VGAPKYFTEDIVPYVGEVRRLAAKHAKQLWLQCLKVASEFSYVVKPEKEDSPRDKIIFAAFEHAGETLPDTIIGCEKCAADCRYVQTMVRQQMETAFIVAFSPKSVVGK